VASTHSPPPHRARTPTPADLLALGDLDDHDLQALLARADELADALAHNPTLVLPTLQGHAVGLLFFEDSTRTRHSFAMAAYRLGAHALELTAPGSSLSKGETLDDTARTIEALGVSALVVRAASRADIDRIARAVTIPVISAGAGDDEHPTQGLLDALTLCRATTTQERPRTRPADLAGLTVLLLGDLARSRVARSTGPCMARLGARVLLAGPAIDQPLAHRLAGEPADDPDDALANADAAIALRIQHERRGEANAIDPGTLRERYGLTARRQARMKPGAWVMHPGPMNLGVEIDEHVARGERSLIAHQVRTGVPVRMACLERAIRPR